MFADETRDNETELRGRENFKINVFYVVWDSLVQDLRRRLESYSEVESTLKCFFINDQNIIDDSLEKLSVKYQGDIKSSNLREEFQHFQILCKNSNSVTINQKFKLAQSVRSIFPNIITLLEIYFTIPLPNTSAARSFSALKRVKNCLRSTMGKNRLDALSLLNVESDSMDNIDAGSLIKRLCIEESKKKIYFKGSFIKKINI